MDLPSNFIPGIILLIIAIAEIGLFLYFFRYQKTITINAYLAFIGGVIIWVASNNASYLHGDGDITVMQKIAFLGGTILSAAFLLFIHTFPHPVSRIFRVLIGLSVVSTLIFSCLLFLTDLFLNKKGVLLSNGLYDTVGRGPVVWIWSLFILALWILSAIELLRRFFTPRVTTKSGFVISSSACVFPRSSESFPMSLSRSRQFTISGGLAHFFLSHGFGVA
jgi:hypothetical protein